MVINFPLDHQMQLIDFSTNSFDSFLKATKIGVDMITLERTARSRQKVSIIQPGIDRLIGSTQVKFFQLRKTSIHSGAGGKTTF
jgi:hypothetical protein